MGSGVSKGPPEPSLSRTRGEHDPECTQILKGRTEHPVRCNKCYRKSKSTEIFKCCSGCKSAYSCSEGCHKAGWKVHKRVCKVDNSFQGRTSQGSQASEISTEEVPALESSTRTTSPQPAETEADTLADCSICMEPFTTQSIRTPCGHTFDFQCIRPWLERSDRTPPNSSQATCPLCRSLIESIQHNRQADGTYETLDMERHLPDLRTERDTRERMLRADSELLHELYVPRSNTIHEFGTAVQRLEGAYNDYALRQIEDVRRDRTYKDYTLDELDDGRFELMRIARLRRLELRNILERRNGAARDLYLRGMAPQSAFETIYNWR
jgi:hypothetical protein